MNISMLYQWEMFTFTVVYLENYDSYGDRGVSQTIRLGPRKTMKKTDLKTDDI